MNIEKITDIFSDKEVINAFLICAKHSSEYEEKLLQLAKESTSSRLLKKLAIAARDMYEECGYDEGDTYQKIIAQVWKNKHCSVDTYVRTGQILYKAHTVFLAFLEISFDAEKLKKIAKADNEGWFDGFIAIYQKEVNREIYDIIVEHNTDFICWCIWADFLKNPDLSEELFEYIIKDIHKIATLHAEDFLENIAEAVSDCEERFLERIMKAIYEENDREAIKEANFQYKNRMGKPFKVH